MACRDNVMQKYSKQSKDSFNSSFEPERLFFGVDSRTEASRTLQNNLTAFEWAVRNKVYPEFWGRDINGEHPISTDEIEFLHQRGCKIIAIYIPKSNMITINDGKLEAIQAVRTANKLGIYRDSIVFFDIEESVVTKDYLYGLITEMLLMEYIPGVKASTDSRYSFDSEFSMGLEEDIKVFEKCVIWATAPRLVQYDNITTSHLIYPDYWMPFAPTGISKNEISIWQYGANCHPINDIKDNRTTFNVNLVNNENTIIQYAF